MTTERTTLLEVTLSPFSPGLKWCFHVLREELLLSSLGRCLQSDLMQFKNKHTVEYQNIVKQAVSDCAS